MPTLVHFSGSAGYGSLPLLPIVNLNRVHSVSGNANGDKLFLKDFPDLVPVARRYGKKILGILKKV